MKTLGCVVPTRPKYVAACKVEPYQLVNREGDKDEGDAVSKNIIIEDGLKDVENLLDLEDLRGDSIGAKYLRMVSTVSFSYMCAHLVEVPASEHGSPEVKAAKRNVVQNIKDCGKFKDVQDDGQDRIGC